MLDLSAQLQNIAALPADRPMTMPGAFYTSQEQFDREAATAASHSHPTNQPTNQPNLCNRTLETHVFFHNGMNRTHFW